MENNQEAGSLGPEISPAATKAAFGCTLEERIFYQFGFTSGYLQGAELILLPARAG